MLQVIPEIQEALRARSATIFVLVRMAFKSGVVAITDAPRDFELEGVFYSADGGLKAVSPPKSEGEISRDLFNVEVTDHDMGLRDILDLENVGVPIDIVSCFTDSVTGQVLNGTLPVYSGVISKVSWSVTDDDEPIVAIECSGPFTKLQQTTHRTTTEASQKAVFPNDTSMDKSFDTENETTIKWGGLS